MLNTQYPEELKVYLEDPKVIKLGVGDLSLICPNCGGWGILALFQIESGPYRSCPGKGKWLDLPGKSGWYLGKMKTANCPVCRGGHMQQYLMENCGLVGPDLEIRLDQFMTNGPFAPKAEAKMVAQNLLAMNHNPMGFITFWGLYGRGKTHILKSLVNGFRLINVVAQYRLLSDLLAEIREKFGDEKGKISSEGMIESFRGVQVLCLDEINQVNLTPWAMETMNRLLDYRYSQRLDLLTVMALNADPCNLPIEYHYLTSRMQEGLIVQVRGDDVRPARGGEMPVPYRDGE